MAGNGAQWGGRQWWAVRWQWWAVQWQAVAGSVLVDTLLATRVPSSSKKASLKAAIALCSAPKRVSGATSRDSEWAAKVRTR